MSTHATIPIILLSLAAGGAGGYLLRAHKTDGSVVLSLKDVVQEEYLAPPGSFSRVQNTRDMLDALSVRAAIGIMDAVSAYDQLPKNSESEKKKARELLERAINAAEMAMQEFQGTEQQLEVAHGLLLALEKAGRFDRWTEVYLHVLHEYPSQPLVSRLAKDAVKIGELAGQQKKVLEALWCLSAFPAPFAGRTEVVAALRSAHACLDPLQISCGAAEPCGTTIREVLN